MQFQNPFLELDKPFGRIPTTLVHNVVNKIYNKQIKLPFLTNPLFMPNEKYSEHNNYGSFPFDLPDVGSENPIEDDLLSGDKSVDLSEGVTNKR